MARYASSYEESTKPATLGYKDSFETVSESVKREIELSDRYPEIYIDAMKTGILNRKYMDHVSTAETIQEAVKLFREARRSAINDVEEVIMRGTETGFTCFSGEGE